jgi:hypothetical protein
MNGATAAGPQSGRSHSVDVVDPTPDPTSPAMAEKSARSDRNIETRKKKARRVIPRDTVTRIQGNTAGARKRLKKMAAKRQNAAAKVASAG